MAQTTPAGTIVRIPAESVRLEGILALPADAVGVVVFAHGSGSSRLSPRNALVASVLNRAGFGTLLFDLLTAEEDVTYENRFEIGLLSRRLVTVTRWLRETETGPLPLGLFGASTGAAAALVAAAELGDVGAVVSRGGRPDLADEALEGVTAPVLLIVGGADTEVIELNRVALDRLAGTAELSIVPGATHLFDEPGALEEVSRLAAAWFERYLPEG